MRLGAEAFVKGTQPERGHANLYTHTHTHISIRQFTGEKKKNEEEEESSLTRHQKTISMLITSTLLY